MDLFASALNHQVKSYVYWIEDHRHIFSQLGGGRGEGEGGDQLMYAFPPFNLEMSAKGNKRQSSSSACGFSMEVHTTVSNIVGPSNRSAISTLPVDPLLVHLPWENLPHPLLNHHNFRLAV